MAIERTLALVKPPARPADVRLAREFYEAAGLHILRFRHFRFDSAMASEFYAEHRNKDFFERLILYMTSNPCWAFLIKGENAVARVREINGATNPGKASKQSIRGRLAERFNSNRLAENFVHSSDSIEAARREIAMIFG